MRDEQIIEAMAGLEGWDAKRIRGVVSWFMPGGDQGNYPPQYLSDRNAMHRVRRSLTDDELKRVGHELEQMCGNTLHPWVLLSLATCGDWCEAILKAKGLWQKD